MKRAWKKDEQVVYHPPRKPVLVDLPAQKYFVVDGQGDPNGEAYAERLGVLYSLTYTLKMLPKSGFTPEGYYEYMVYPLEGVWDLKAHWAEGTPLDKTSLAYLAMIRQPDFADDALAAHVLAIVRKKKPHPLLDTVRFETIADGLSVQMMHHGPYDDEPASFAQMQQFIDENGLERIESRHREIYLGDPRKTRPENLRTVLRYRVRKK